MKKLLLICTFMLAFGLAAPVHAQGATAAWNAPTTATTLADAQALHWTLYVQPRVGAALVLPLTGAVCVGTVAPFQCTAPVPPQGAPASYDWSYQITATTPLGSESTKSAVFISPISAPTGLSIGVP